MTRQQNKSPQETEVHRGHRAAPRESADTPVDLALRPRRLLLGLFLLCVAAELGFILLDWHVNYGRLVDAAPIRNLFNTTREDGIASWFGVTQTALAALTLWLVFFVVRARGGPRWTRFGWLALAAFFGYMAFDDGTEFHERIGTTLAILGERAGDSSADDGSSWLAAFPSYPWQVVFLPGFAAMGLFMLIFLWRELGTGLPRNLVVVGVACFVTAVGLDFVEGLDEQHPFNLNARIAALPAVADYAHARFGREPYETVRHFGKSVEESLEMLGMTLLWMALLGHALRLLDDVRLTCEPAAPSRSRRHQGPPVVAGSGLARTSATPHSGY